MGRGTRLEWVYYINIYTNNELQLNVLKSFVFSIKFVDVLKRIFWLYQLKSMKCKSIWYCIVCYCAHHTIFYFLINNNYFSFSFLLSHTVVQGADHVPKVLNVVAVIAVDDQLKNIVKNGDLIINHRGAAIINGQDPEIDPESVQDAMIHIESVRIVKVQLKLKH